METSLADSRAISTIVEDHHILKGIQTTDCENDKRNAPSEKDVNQNQDEDEDLLTDPGDVCAICITTIEREHHIRGLACGHAFHITCIDPWLTSRRACCPLFETDYYAPKPFPRGKVTEPERPGRVILAGHPGDGISYRPLESRHLTRERQAAAAATGSTPGPPPSQQSNAGAPRSLRLRVSDTLRAVHIPALLIPRRARVPDSAAEKPTESSPCQLEAGVMH